MRAGSDYQHHNHHDRVLSEIGVNIAPLLAGAGR